MPVSQRAGVRHAEVLVGIVPDELRLRIYGSNRYLLDGGESLTIRPSRFARYAFRLKPEIRRRVWKLPNDPRRWVSVNGFICPVDDLIAECEVF